MSGDVFTIGELAKVVGIHPRAMTKLLNDAGAAPRYSEVEDHPEAPVSRELVVDLFAMRAGDRVGRKLAGVLR